MYQVGSLEVGQNIPERHSKSTMIPPANSEMKDSCCIAGSIQNLILEDRNSDGRGLIQISDTAYHNSHEPRTVIEIPSVWQADAPYPKEAPKSFLKLSQVFALEKENNYIRYLIHFREFNHYGLN